MVSLKSAEEFQQNFTKEWVFRRLVLSLAIVLLILRAAQGSTAFLLLGSLLGCGLFLIGILKKEATTLPSIIAVLIFIISYVFTYLNNFFSNGVLFLFLMFGSYGVAWEIFKNGLNVNFSRFLFYFSSALYLFFYAVLGYEAGEILDHSRNHVSVYFIGLTTLLFVALESENVKRIREYIVPSLITVLISILAIGISGIISSLLLFALVCLFALKEKGGKPLVLLGFFVISILGLFYYGFDVGNVVVLDRELLGKLSTDKFTSDVRYDIWREYILSLDGVRFLAGVPLSEVFHTHQNLHSSYFLLHQRIGLLAFVIFAIFLISLLRVYRINKLLFACLVSILLRGMSDTTFFSASAFDFALLYLVLFYPYKEKVLKYD